MPDGTATTDEDFVVAVPEFGDLGKAWLGLLALLIAAGLVAWVYQLSTGLVATGMRNVVAWGLYIMMFVLFVGLSAGGMIVSSAPKFFHSDSYENVSRIGVLLSLGCITVAGLMIIPDIGRPERLYQFFTTPSFRSPMVWDFGIVVLYGLFNCWYLWLLTRRDLAAAGSRLAFGVEDTEAGRERDRKLAFWSAAAALPAAVLLHSNTGWIFGTQIAHGSWFSPLVAPIFIAKALVSGLGLLLVTAILADRFTEFELDESMLPRLGKILGVFLAVHVVYLLAAERLPHVWAEHFGFWAILGGFLLGDTVYFWIWTVIGGAVPLAMLAVPSLRRKTSVVFAASALAVFGVVFEGIRLIFIGYNQVNIAAPPGIPVGQPATGLAGDIWARSGAYTPTLVEVVITVGVVAVGALIVTLGLRFLPIQSQSQVPSAEPIETDGGTDEEGSAS